MNNNVLRTVWNHYSLEEILSAGLDYNKISSSDIVHASDMYKDPNKEYDDEEVKEIISSHDLGEIMKILQNEYSLDTILDELPKDDILDNIDANDRLMSLENTWELDQHDEEVKEEYYREYIDEWIDEFTADQKDHMNNVCNWSSDELHMFLCDAFGCGYYDKNMPEKLKNKLNHNTYNIKYE